MKRCVPVALCSRSWAVGLLVEICQWCWKILSFLREGGDAMSCFAIQRKMLSLSTAGSCWEMHTVQPAWQSPLSGLKHAASRDAGLLQASLRGFAEGGGGAPTAIRSSGLAET